jgi:hypothetical protein
MSWDSFMTSTLPSAQSASNVGTVPSTALTFCLRVAGGPRPEVGSDGLERDVEIVDHLGLPDASTPTRVGSGGWKEEIDVMPIRPLALVEATVSLPRLIATRS